MRVADSMHFHVAKTIAAALFSIKPGALRELHWHPHSEWQYYIDGSARMTVFAWAEQARTMDYNPNHVGYVPAIAGHLSRGLETMIIISGALQERSMVAATPRAVDGTAPPS